MYRWDDSPNGQIGLHRLWSPIRLHLEATVARRRDGATTVGARCCGETIVGCNGDYARRYNRVMKWRISETAMQSLLEVAMVDERGGDQGQGWWICTLGESNFVIWCLWSSSFKQNNIFPNFKAKMNTEKINY